MQYINERLVAQKNYLNKKPLKRKLIIFVILIAIITSIVLIWGYVFSGFLYLKIKRITINHYENVVLKTNKNYINSLDKKEKELFSKFIVDKQKWWQKQENNKYTGKYEIENIYTKDNIIFSITDKFWKKETQNIKKLNSNFMPTIFFVYGKKTKKLNDLLYKFGHMQKLREYKNG